MPGTPLIRYELDPTGINPDNRVTGEIRDLPNLPNRVCGTTYGPFFANSMQVFDNLDGRLLIRDIDYKLGAFSQETSLKFGAPINRVIIVTNTSVSPQVRLNYQLLGGPYQNSSESIAEAYAAFLADNRPVDWSNVLNRPDTYPPSLHHHWLSEIYGFGPMTDQLERIRDAIVLSNIPAFEELVNWVNSKGLSILELDAQIEPDKYVTHGVLLHALQSLNFNALNIDPQPSSAVVGQSLTFSVASTNLPNPTTLYWTIEHNGTSDADFSTTAGVFSMSRNRGSFGFSIVNNMEGDANPFSVAIRRFSTTGPIIGMIRDIMLGGGSVVGNETSAIDLLNACCVMEPHIYRTARSFFYIGDR